MLYDNPYLNGNLDIYMFIIGLRILRGSLQMVLRNGMEILIATHTSLAVLTDAIFALLYIGLSRIKDNRRQPYFHLTFFKL